MDSFTALLRYYHTVYIRSFRYIAPALLYFGGIAWLYAIVPNPVMPSYGLTAVLLYVISVWLAYGYMDAEPDAQQILTALHARGFLRSVAAKLTYLTLFIVPFAVFAVVYPPLAGAFDRTATMPELGLALAGHLLLAWLGIGSGIFFSERLFPKSSYKLPALLLVIAVIVGAEGIRAALPSYAAPIFWLLPPVRLVMNALIGEGESNPGTAMAAAGAYAVLLFALFAAAVRRKGL